MTKDRVSALRPYNLEKWTQYTAEELIPRLLISWAFSHCPVSLVPGHIDNCTCYCLLGSVERYLILGGFFFFKKLIFIILFHIYIYLVTPWCRVLLEKLTGSAASQEIPHIFGTRSFITVLTSASHLSLS